MIIKIIFTIITLSLLGFLPFWIIGKRMDKTEVEDMEDEIGFDHWKMNNDWTEEDLMNRKSHIKTGWDGSTYHLEDEEDLEEFTKKF